MDNMEIWNKVKTPPKTALKKITGGRLAGMTDISPQWRFEVLTEIFGPVGFGWKYTIEKLWLEPGTDGQFACFALVNLYWNIVTTEGSCWSDPIPGIGGNMFIAKEKNGMHTSDEAYKMAVTDAISVAAKTLGIGADVYAGRMDGSKYSKPEPKPTPEPKQTKGPNIPAKPEYITKDQQSTIIDMVAEAEADIEKMLSYCGCDTFETIPAVMFDTIMTTLQQKIDAKVKA